MSADRGGGVGEGSFDIILTPAVQCGPFPPGLPALHYTANCVRFKPENIGLRPILVGQAVVGKMAGGEDDFARFEMAKDVLCSVI